MLLVHGDDDRNVPFNETIELVEKLREPGIEHELLIFPDEVHGFLRHENWLEVFRRSANFFERIRRSVRVPERLYQSLVSGPSAGANGVFRSSPGFRTPYAKV